MIEELIRQHYYYIPDTGEIWKNGSKIGYPQKGTMAVKVNGRRQSFQRIAWILMTKEEPDRRVYHINGLYFDNRWENLVLANPSQAIGLRPPYTNNALLRKNVTKTLDGYRARVKRLGKDYSKNFKTSDEAYNYVINTHLMLYENHSIFKQ